MRTSLLVFVFAALSLSGCATAVDPTVTQLARNKLGATGDCHRDSIEVFWPAYRENVAMYSCGGRDRGWCVLTSPGRHSVADVTRFMYRTLHRADGDWATRPPCLRWHGVQSLRPPGGDPAVAALPARLYRP